MRHVVTHGGKAHFDEFFAVGLLLCISFDSPETFPPVYRRDPTEEELEDPDVAVIDIGGRHEPEKLNFDHHHDESLNASFRLVAQHFEIEEGNVDSILDRGHEWYGYKDLLDRKGPTRAANSVGVQGDTKPLQSPVESWVISQFAEVGTEEDSRQVEKSLAGLAALFAKDQIDRALSVKERMDTFRKVGGIEQYGGLRVFVVEREPDTFVLRQLRDEIGFDATLTENPREEGGMALYRYDDVDLDLQEASYSAFPQGKPIIFAHNTGFFAVCRTEADAREVFREATRLSDSYASAEEGEVQYPRP